MATARPFPLFATRGDDVDPEETQDWLESIDSVLRVHGAERAHYLLECMIDHARRSGAYLPYSPNTAYLNTIPVGQQPNYPGDRGIERRIEAYIRWNALAMVVHANRKSSEYGGHIASYASSATLYEVGFNHFWRAPTAEHGGDLVYFQGHSSPGIYARAYLEGRLTEENLNYFRQEVVGPGSLVVSAPMADAGVLAVPDGVDGLGPDDGDLPSPLHALSRGAQHFAFAGSQGLVLPRRRRDGRARVDGRDHDAGSREARQLDLRDQLQSAAARRSGARQRQDHPGARGRVSGRRLERDQGGLGLSLGSLARARRQRTAAQDDGGVRRRRVPELQSEGRRVHARALLRPLPRAQGDGREHVRRGHLAFEPRRPRRGQGVRGVSRGREPQGPARR